MGHSLPPGDTSSREPFKRTYTPCRSALSRTLSPNESPPSWRKNLAAGVTRVPLPPRSPNLNAYAERWVRSVKEECLARLILLGEAALHHALPAYVAGDHR